MKKYIAKTNISINIVLPSGANRHIAFCALTGGGSVYYTDDPEIIQAMERHYKYGTLFRADPKYAAGKRVDGPVPKAKPKIMQTQAATDTGATTADLPETEFSTDNNEPTEGAGEETGGETGFKKIVVTDPDDAKGYLAEHFGVSRTKIKGVKTIKEIAAAKGIVFEGI
mgnify:CR=1 FL=1